MFQPLQLIDYGVGAFCVLFVGTFAGIVFPRQLAEEGEANLPKRSLALLLFACINIILFLALVTFLYLCQNYEQVATLLKAVKAAGISESVDELLRRSGISAGKSPFSAEMFAAATAVFFGLFGFRRWRKIEAGALQVLHGVNLIDEDARKLAVMLRNGGELQSDDANPAPAALKRLQGRALEAKSVADAQSLAAKWTRLDALLQIWKKDESYWSKTLPKGDLPKLDSIRKAHERRSDLACRLDQHVADVERGLAGPMVLANIAEMVQRNDVSPESILEELRSSLKLSTDSPKDEHSLSILLQPVVQYFHDEYDEALAHMADATAKAVAMSGDDAKKRVEILKDNHFTGFNAVEPINIQTTIGIIFGILVIQTLLFTFYNQFFNPLDKPAPFGLLAASAGSITLAVLAGTMVGGLRILARAETTPWGWYILTALIMAILHLVITLAVLSNSAIDPSDPHFGNAAVLIAAIIPFCLVLAICLMSRQEVSPPSHEEVLLPVWFQYAAVWFRAPILLRDAILLALIMAVMGIVILFIANAAIEEPIMIHLVRFPTLLALLGAIVGALVVNRVRQAALSRIVK